MKTIGTAATLLVVAVAAYKFSMGISANHLNVDGSIGLTGLLTVAFAIWVYGRKD